MEKAKILSTKDGYSSVRVKFPLLIGHKLVSHYATLFPTSPIKLRSSKSFSSKPKLPTLKRQKHQRSMAMSFIRASFAVTQTRKLWEAAIMRVTRTKKVN